MIDPRIIRVRDVMTNKFRIMDGLATIQEGLQAMKNSDVRAIIVGKRHDNDAHGIVLLSDMAKKVLAKNRSRSRTSLYEIMQTLEIVPQTGPRDLGKSSFTLIGEDAFSISHTQVWLKDGAIKGFTLVWPAGELRSLLDRNPSMRVAVQAVLSSCMADKLQRTPDNQETMTLPVDPTV